MNYFSRSANILLSILFADDTIVLIEGTHLNYIYEGFFKEDLFKINKSI